MSNKIKGVNELTKMERANKMIPLRLGVASQGGVALLGPSWDQPKPRGFASMRPKPAGSVAQEPTRATQCGPV